MVDAQILFEVCQWKSIASVPITKGPKFKVTHHEKNSLGFNKYKSNHCIFKLGHNFTEYVHVGATCTCVSIPRETGDFPWFCLYTYRRRTEWNMIVYGIELFPRRQILVNGDRCCVKYSSVYVIVRRDSILTVPSY